MAIYPLEYLSVLKRRKLVFFAVSGTIILLSLIFALRWKNYEAFATVEVSRPEISMDVVETAGTRTVTAELLADMQISRLKQKVLSTASLAEVITKLDLYPESRKTTPIAYIAEDMRKKINVRLLSTSLANPASAQKASAIQLSAIAFVLTFSYNDPALSQKTVNELVSRFLDEDLKERRNTAKKTSEFLDGQIAILTENLEEQEEKIAAFRAENGDIRSDALAFNQQAAATTTSRLLAIESEIISNLGVVGALRSQLAQTNPYARVVDEGGEVLTTPSIQLRALKSQYASLTAKYGPNHPDVTKVARQMQALEADVDPKAFRARLNAQIADVSGRLQIAEQEYGPEHPDVISLQKQKDSLDKQLSSAKSGGSGASGVIRDADNPAYLQVVAQIDAAREQQKALEQQREEVKKQDEEYRKAVAQNPAAEQQMAAMARDYDNLMSLYRDLKAKKLASEMNETIELGSIGQRLSVIEAPQVPLSTKPSRKLFLAAGIVFGVAAGIACVFVLQILGQGVMGPNHLQSLIGVAPLVTIPHLKTLDERISSRRLLMRFLTVLPIIVAVLLLLFFAMVMPFDVFWATLTRKLGL